MEKTIAELNAEFQAHKSESDRRHDEIFERVISFDEKFSEKIASLEKNKISYKQFYWIIGTLISLLMTVCGYIVVQINSLQSITIAVQQDVAQVKGRLEPYDIEFKH